MRPRISSQYIHALQRIYPYIPYMHSFLQCTAHIFPPFPTQNLRLPPKSGGNSLYPSSLSVFQTRRHSRSYCTTSTQNAATASLHRYSLCLPATRHKPAISSRRHLQQVSRCRHSCHMLPGCMGYGVMLQHWVCLMKDYGEGLNWCGKCFWAHWRLVLGRVGEWGCLSRNLKMVLNRISLFWFVICLLAHACIMLGNRFELSLNSVGDVDDFRLIDV